MAKKSKKNEVANLNVDVTINYQSAPDAVEMWLAANKDSLFIQAGYREGSWLYLTDFTVELRNPEYKPVRETLKAAGFTFFNTKRRGEVWVHRTFGHDMEKSGRVPLNL